MITDTFEDPDGFDDWDYCHEPVTNEEDGPIPTVGLDDTDTAEIPIDEGNTPPF